MTRAAHPSLPGPFGGYARVVPSLALLGGAWLSSHAHMAQPSRDSAPCEHRHGGGSSSPYEAWQRFPPIMAQSSQSGMPACMLQTTGYQLSMGQACPACMSVWQIQGGRFLGYGVKEHYIQITLRLFIIL